MNKFRVTVFVLAVFVLLPVSLSAVEETERSFDMQGLNSLSVSYGSASVTIDLCDGNSLVIREQLNRVENAGVETFGSSMSITGGRTKFALFGWGVRNRTYISIPRSFQGSIKLTIRSGTLRGTDNFSTPGDADITLRSGIIELQRLSAGKIRVEVSSGTFSSRGLYGEADLSVSSGSIKIEELDGTVHNMEVNSGNIKAQQVRGKLNAATHSGNINIDLAELVADLSLSVRSGGIRLSLPRNAAFNLDAETSSGGISVRSAGSDYKLGGNSTVLRPIGENPRHTILARVRSGNISITGF